MPLSISCAVPTPCTQVPIALFPFVLSLSLLIGSQYSHGCKGCKNFGRQHHCACVQRLHMSPANVHAPNGTYVTHTNAPQTHKSVPQRLTECLTCCAKLQDLYTVFEYNIPLGQVSSMYLHERIEGFIDHRHQHSVHNEAWPVIGVAHSLAQVLCKAIGSLVNLFASAQASLSMNVRQEHVVSTMHSSETNRAPFMGSQ